jgi:hypothetical protein
MPEPEGSFAHGVTPLEGKRREALAPGVDAVLGIGAKDPEHRQRIDRVFALAIDLPEGHRARFLERGLGSTGTHGRNQSRAP